MTSLRRVVTLAALLAIAGCGLPTSPSIHVVRRILTEHEQPDPDIRRIAPGPASGATPEQIVRGFLAAESNDDDQHAVARQFIAVPSSWDATGSTEVYDETSLQIAVVQHGAGSGGTADATVSFARKGRIAADGSFLASQAPERQTLELTRVLGQWRLLNVPTGLQLSLRDVARAFTPATVWFLSRDSSQPRLVPDPRLLPAPSAGRASALVRSLLAGPSSHLSPAVKSAASSTVQLRGSAVLVDGVVSVDLSQAGASLRGEQLRLFLAQLAVTLEQVPGAAQLRVTAVGRALTGASSSPVSLLELASALPPTADDAGTPAVRPIALVGGRISSLGTSEARSSPAPVVWPDIAQLTALATEPDLQQVSALQQTPSGKVLLTGTASGQPSRVLGPAPLDAISISPDGGTLVHRGGGDPALLLVDRSGVRRVTLPPSIPAGEVTALSVSRDGTHVAIVLGAGIAARLVVAVLVPGSEPHLVALGGSLPEVESVVSVAWFSSTHVVAIASSAGSSVRPLDVTIDGSAISPLTTAGLPRSITAVTSWGGARLLVAADRQAWVLSSGWASLGRADRVAYL